MGTTVSDVTRKMTVIGSLVASTLWHVVKIYPLTRECIDSLQSEIWKFVWSKKPEWVRRETCKSHYLNGGLRIINLDIKSKALLIGRVFRFLEESEAPLERFHALLDRTGLRHKRNLRSGL